jgi:phosphatidylglycerol:prolipoprotein diacylglycerol transferase
LYPELISFGPVTIHTYGAFLALGAGLGLWLLTRLAPANGLDPDRAMTLAVCVLVAGVIGSRAVFVILEWESFANAPGRLIRFWEGGLVFYGGVAAGVPTALFLIKRWKLPALPLLDCLAPALALGQFFGRLGCFSAGCCYGLPWEGWCAVTFNSPLTLAARGIPLHPSQIYHAAELLFVLAVLLLLWRRRVFHGQIFFTYGLLHGVFRVIIEQFRGDYRGEPLIAWVTPTAAFALAFALVSAVALVYLYKKHKSQGGSDGLHG